MLQLKSYKLFSHFLQVVSFAQSKRVLKRSERAVSLLCLSPLTPSSLIAIDAAYDTT